MGKSDEVLKRLREEAETFERDQDGVEWGWVYLDNARLSFLTPREFRSCLAALSRKKLYRPGEDAHAFGIVRMEEAQRPYAIVTTIEKRGSDGQLLS